MSKTTKTVTYEAEQIARKKINYFSSLPEKQRRHFLAQEYLQLGPGSQRYLSKLFDCSRQTIINGVKELEATDFKVDYSRQRKVGGGRKKRIDKS
jgi:biotin operon repressor